MSLKQHALHQQLAGKNYTDNVLLWSGGVGLVGLKCDLINQLASFSALTLLVGFIL